MNSVTIDIYYPRPYSGKDRAEYFATIDGVKRPSSFDELTSLLDNEDNERVVCPSTYYHRQFKFYTPPVK